MGKKNEDSTNQYFVRHPDEAETYIAELDINLTTKFGDWVNTDLLEITDGDIVRLDLNDYSFDEIQGTITGNIESVLSRDSSSADWELEGIDAETEQVKTAAVTETLTALTTLEIAGVRPKQAGLTPDLQIDRAALRSQGDFDRLSRDLLSRGFLLQPNRENKELLELISREGEMFVGASDGLLYRLYFGRAFTGSNEDLEIDSHPLQPKKREKKLLPMRKLLVIRQKTRRKVRKRHQVENLEDTYLFALTSMRRF